MAGRENHAGSGLDNVKMLRRFIISTEDIIGDSATLTGQNARHLKTVLRLNPGEAVILVDGKGTEYKGVIRTIDPDRVEVAIREKSASIAESPVHIIVAQALLKDKKMDGLIRQLTELGVSNWLPFTAARSIPRPSKKRMDTRLDRWRKITTEALKQCRRGRAIDISCTMNFESALSHGSDCDLKIMFWEGATFSLEKIETSGASKPPQKIIALFGPEGGFTRDEVASAKAEGFAIATLGPRILKAETATIAGCTLLQFLFGDMGYFYLDKTQRRE